METERKASVEAQALTSWALGVNNGIGSDTLAAVFSELYASVMRSLIHLDKVVARISFEWAGLYEMNNFLC